MINILRMINKEKSLIDEELEQEDERLTGYWMTKYQLKEN